MLIKAGKYTLALTFVIGGIIMLINNINGNYLFDSLWFYSPLVLVLFGLEIVLLSLIYWNKPEYKVESSIGSIILIILIVAFFMTWRNRVEIHDPFFDSFIRIKL